MELVKISVKNFIVYIYYIQICFSYNNNKSTGLVKIILKEFNDLYTLSSDFLQQIK